VDIARDFSTMGCFQSSLTKRSIGGLLTGNGENMEDESVASVSDVVALEGSNVQSGVAISSPVPVSPIHDEAEDTPGDPSEKPVTDEKLEHEQLNEPGDPTTIEKSLSNQNMTEKADLFQIKRRSSAQSASSPERRESKSPMNTEAIKVDREKDFSTPSKSKRVRRRIDGSPILPDCNMPRKTVYLFRHGYSQGQAAQKNGLDRKTDPSLRDCALTERGIEEARAIPKQFLDDERDSIEVVFSSPLTRALHTSILGFPNKNIICHFDLGEIGTKAPENIPRKMAAVLQDLREDIEKRDSSLTTDTTTFQPSDWPRDTAPGVIKKEKVKKFFQWLYKERQEKVIAVVCHHNVIKTVVINGEKLRPKNAELISCSLNSNGELFLVNGLETNDDLPVAALDFGASTS